MIADRLRAIQHAASSPVFSPSQLSGLQLWLKADTGVTPDGSGGVSAWADQSGNGRNVTQATTTSRPTINSSTITGIPTVVFDGVDDELNLAATLSVSDCSIYWYGKILEVPGSTSALLHGPNALWALNNYNNGLYWYEGSDILQSANSAISQNQTYLIELHRTGSTWTVKANGDGKSIYLETATSADIAGFGKAYSGFSQIAIKEVAIYNRELNSAEKLQLTDYFAQWGDPYYGKTALLLHMDGTNGSTTFVDSGPNALAVTVVGDAKISTANSKYGGAGTFDGAGDYLRIPDPNLFNFGVSDFTVEFWMYPRTITTYGTIATTATPTDFQGIWIGTGPTNRLYFLAGGGSWLFTGYTATNSVTLNAWSHVAYVRSGSSFNVYINGVLAGTATSTASLTNTNNAIQVGGRAIASQYFNGLIDDLAIEKIAKYTSNFTPPSRALLNLYNPFTSLPVSGAALWLDGADSATLFTDAGVNPVVKSGDLVYQWNDKSGNNRHATQTTSGNRPTWNPPASGKNGFGTIAFNGTTQYLNVPLPSLSAGYTVYAVFRQPDLAGNLISIGAGTTGAAFTVYLQGGNIAISQYGAAVFVTTAAVLNTYYGLVGKYDGSHTTGNYLVRTSNASADVTGTMAQNTGTPAAGTANIGRESTGSPYYNGVLCELIVFDSQRSTAEDSAIKSYFTNKWGIIWS